MMFQWERTSRKFRVLLYDTVVSIAVFFATHYLAPQLQEPALFLIGALQAPVLAIIAGTAWEDAAEKSGLRAFDDGYAAGHAVADLRSGTGGEEVMKVSGTDTVTEP